MMVVVLLLLLWLLLLLLLNTITGTSSAELTPITYPFDEIG